MNPNAVAHADTISAPMTEYGDVSATATKMGITSAMLRILKRSVRNGRKIMADYIERQAVIDALYHVDEYNVRSIEAIRNLPSAQPERTDCEYCHEDSDGYVCPIEKNSHAWLVRRGRTMKLRVRFKGGYSECDISFCPMCGRRLKHE